jgi:hypothetical protein
MDRSRREFLKYFGAAVIGGSIGGLMAYLGLDSYSEVTKTIYEGNKPANATETVTITVTKPAINPQASQTYTTTTTVTETTTQTNSTTTQPPQNLEQILFGNSNMQFIPLEVTDVEIGNYNAYLTVYDRLTQTELQIELPIKYVSNGNINIKDLLLGVNNYNLNNATNYRTYLVLGRANINQAVQQNGKWILPAPQIYYNMLISDRGWKDIYKALPNLWNENAMVVMPTLQQGPYSNSLYGRINGIGSIIILYQNGQQVNSVLNYINLADSILGTPNNSNPTEGGILHVDTIASTQGSGVYENKYLVVGINNYLGTYIVFRPKLGYPLFSNL